MARRIIWMLFAVAMITAASPAHATARYVGSCVKALHLYPTISAAVKASVANDRINVCPGTYPEQVTISIPLFLAGMEAASGTAAEDRAVITLPSNPVVNAMSPAFGISFVAQILVRNVNPAGSFGVAITNLTVDGSADPAGQRWNCPNLATGPGVVGIYYDATTNAPGTVGNIGDVTAMAQLTQGLPCGYGIWVENDGPNNQSVTIQNNSVHDFDAEGITVVGTPNLEVISPPTITATIQGNFVHAVGPDVFGIEAEDIAGTIAGNIVTGGVFGIVNDSSTISITHNTVAGAGSGIFLDVSSTAASNNISNVGTAFVLKGGNFSPGPTIQSNTTKNTQTVLEYNCTPNATVTSNTFSDSATAFSDVLGGKAPTTTNSLFNIDSIKSGTCP